MLSAFLWRAALKKDRIASFCTALSEVFGNKQILQTDRFGGLFAFIATFVKKTD